MRQRPARPLVCPHTPFLPGSRVCRSRRPPPRTCQCRTAGGASGEGWVGHCSGKPGPGRQLTEVTHIQECTNQRAPPPPTPPTPTPPHPPPTPPLALQLERHPPHDRPAGTHVHHQASFMHAFIKWSCSGSNVCCRCGGREAPAATHVAAVARPCRWLRRCGLRFRHGCCCCCCCCCRSF